ncbi:SulP family inorganic anion transporter [Marinomonas sp. 2405UD68-3]|uniref:SulP family inorganic anion transporter n=1 Tax=Marinomonas sp. 2405UD68-3 TaxID=3391835 RepID=UPI0039C98A05
MQPNNVLPLQHWLKSYTKTSMVNDFIAGIIATIVMIPQGMAYALLAGVPAEYGLYCAILPTLLYALLGSSRSLSVGPAALISIMVASSIGALNPQSDAEYLHYAVNISFLSGLFLIAMRVFRLGSITNFISMPVVSGFTSASAIIITTSQLKHILGIPVASGLSFDETLWQLGTHINDINYNTLVAGILACVGLWYFKGHFPKLVKKLSLPAWLDQAISKAGPMFVVAIAAILVGVFKLHETANIAIVGLIPNELPSLAFVPIDLALWKSIALPSFLIALMCFVTSITVGTSLASKRKERIDANQELLALGAANLGAAFSGTFSLAASMSRSAVNHSAGAETTIASMICAFGVLLTLLFLTPLFYFLPLVVLGAIVIMSVSSLIEIYQIKRCWTLNKADAYSLLATFITVLIFGIEIGICVGIIGSVILIIHRASHPHIAIVGRVGDSEHFRNIERYDVVVNEHLLAVRVDESIYFSNVQCIENFVFEACYQRPATRHLVLIFSSVSFVDTTAVDALDNMISKFKDLNIQLHLAEVKGPVMDQLENSQFVRDLKPGHIFFTTDEAFKTLVKA